MSNYFSNKSLTFEKHHGKFSDELQTNAEQTKYSHNLTIFLVAHAVKTLAKFKLRNDVNKANCTAWNQYLLRKNDMS